MIWYTYSEDFIGLPKCQWPNRMQFQKNIYSLGQVSEIIYKPQNLGFQDILIIDSFNIPIWEVQSCLRL